ncbi:helix-turn-helix domain-containing protein [Luteimicrobium sp. NPDC057192]|uniref:helix-turn-helix domain-containing protein n=1 Tax=Luteimicrobium sp. NPDC057192 TaxID=3346042 RepID=UPI00362798E0
MSTAPDTAHGQDSRGPDEVVADALENARDLDLATLKALSHPLRVRLWDLLVTAGPATSTTLARQTGESTGSTSYHLRQLASHGLVQEVPDRGTARERWWRAASGALRVRGGGDEYETPSGGEVVRAFGSQWASLRAGSLERFHGRVIDRVEPERWVDASVDATSFAYLTLEELDALSAELGAVLEKYAGVARSREERPSTEHRRIEVQVLAFPTIDPRDEGVTADA